MNAKIGNGLSKLQGFSLVKGYFKTTIFFLVKEATIWTVAQGTVMTYLKKMEKM